MSTPGLDQDTVDELRRDLPTGTGDVQIGRQCIHAWKLSAAERPFLADGSSIVYKAAAAPFPAKPPCREPSANTEPPYPCCTLYATLRDAAC